MAEMIKIAVFDGTRRHNYSAYEDVCETIQAYYGTGGGNTPIVVVNHTGDKHGKES